MTSDQRSAEERLRAAGWTLADDVNGRPDHPSGIYYRMAGLVSIDGDTTWEQDDALGIQRALAAAEARGRAQGQREGREAERADVVAWHQSQADRSHSANEYLVENGRLPSFLMDGSFAAHQTSVSDIKDGKHVGAAARGEGEL